MENTGNRKIKVLYLERMMQETGKENALSMQEILERMESRGISAERKSVYADMEILRSFGMNIQYKRGKGYFLEEESSAEPLLAPAVSENGEERKPVKLLCHSSVRDEVERVFGRDCSYKEKGSDSFTVSVQVEEDGHFYGWLASLGKNAHILKPRKSALAYRDYLKSIVKEYKDAGK